MTQKRQRVRCIEWWLDAVAASTKQKEEEALQFRREAAEVVEACKADVAQLVDAVVQQSARFAEQAAQLETLHADRHTQEVLCYLAYALRLTRMRTHRHNGARV